MTNDSVTNVLIAVLAVLGALILLLLLVCVFLVRKHMSLRKNPRSDVSNPEEMALREGTLTLGKDKEKEDGRTNNNTDTNQHNGGNNTGVPTYAQVDKKQAKKTANGERLADQNDTGSRDLYANTSEEVNVKFGPSEDGVEYAHVDEKSFVTKKNIDTHAEVDSEDVTITYADLDWNKQLTKK